MQVGQRTNIRRRRKFLCWPGTAILGSLRGRCSGGTRSLTGSGGLGGVGGMGGVWFCWGSCSRVRGKGRGISGLKDGISLEIVYLSRERKKIKKLQLIISKARKVEEKCFCIRDTFLDSSIIRLIQSKDRSTFSLVLL